MEINVLFMSLCSFQGFFVYLYIVSFFLAVNILLDYNIIHCRDQSNKNHSTIKNTNNHELIKNQSCYRVPRFI